MRYFDDTLTNLDLHAKIISALDSGETSWRLALENVLATLPKQVAEQPSYQQIIMKLQTEIEELSHDYDTFTDAEELEEIRTRIRRNVSADLRKLENIGPRSSPQDARRSGDESALKIHLSRRDALLQGAAATAVIGTMGAGIANSGQLTKAMHAASVETQEVLHPMDQKFGSGSSLLSVDSAATAYFAWKVKELVQGGAINKYDYYTAISFLAARCLIGGDEVTHHTVEELKFGFESAALAIGMGFAAEGVSAQLPTILKAIKGKDANRAETVASIVAASSVVSPFALTIGSCSAFGDEVRNITTDGGYFNKHALGVMMGHLGDHSALGAGLYSDPPDIPMAQLVGLKNMALLKGIYGQVSALWSLFSTTFKANYFFNENEGQNRFQKTLRETMEGLTYALPALPAFMGHSLRNLGLYAFQQPQNTRGAEFDVMSRLGEALHNTYEIVAHHNPDSIKTFSGLHDPVSSIVKVHAQNMTAFAQGKLDGHARAVEEILETENGVRVQQLIALSKEMIAPETSQETSLNILHAIYDCADKLCGSNADKASALKVQAKTLWLTSSVLHRTKDHPVESISQLVQRVTDIDRLSDAYGHGQMDVLTLLPWQILLSVPISNVLKSGLEKIVASDMPPVAATFANMGLTGAVTGTVDNLAAFLATANAAIKAKQPRLMEGLMASIVFGSATWAGNPIAHSKIASATTHPAYGIGESIDVMPWNSDIYAVTMGWTMAMNGLDMEQRILGQDHPIHKNDSGAAQDHHAQMIVRQQQERLSRRGLFDSLRVA